MKRFFYLFVTFFCLSFPFITVYSADGVLQFKSGFEGTTQITGQISTTSSKEQLIEGKDGDIGNWDALQAGSYSPVSWVKQTFGWFQGGRMEIVSDPAGGSNKVLRLHNTNTMPDGSGTLSRSQWQLNQVPEYWTDDGKPNQFDQQFYRYRMYIPDDITTAVSRSSSARWYMIWESHTWNVSPPSGAEQTRHGIYLQKNSNSDLWYFNVIQERPEGCHGYEGSGSCVIYKDNKTQHTIPVPFDQWFTFDVFFKYHETNGRFYVAITKPDGIRQVIADIQGRTKFEEKLHDQMVFKNYQDGSYVDSLGEVNQYYDDFEIWSDFPPGYFSGDSPAPTIGTSLKPGDASGDGKVDGVDYIVWLNHYGQNVSGTVNGNFDGKNGVDGVDYIVWLYNYGG